MSEFKGRHFRGEIVLWAVRWYCRYAVSYRDLEAMMTERGVAVDHSTIYRWVQRFAPEMEKRLRWQWRRPQSTSWRIDETYVKVRGKWAYLYRALDKLGNTIDFYLSATRNTKAAKRFLGKALRGALWCPALPIRAGETTVKRRSHARSQWAIWPFPSFWNRSGPVPSRACTWATTAWSSLPYSTSAISWTLSPWRRSSRASSVVSSRPCAFESCSRAPRTARAAAVVDQAGGNPTHEPSAEKDQLHCTSGRWTGAPSAQSDAGRRPRTHGA